MDEEALPVFAEAMRIIGEHSLVTNDGISYQDQGYVVVGGGIPSWVLDNHKFVSSLERRFKKEVHDIQMRQMRK